MTSHTTYVCDFCGEVIERDCLQLSALGVRVISENCRSYLIPVIQKDGDGCKRCHMILTNAVRDALKKCEEARRG